MTHTPGPWIATQGTYPKPDRTIYVGTPKADWPREVYDVVASFDMADYTDEYRARQWANARLIAAAPDLLMLCRRALASLRQHVDREETLLMREIDEAIARATGGIE